MRRTLLLSVGIALVCALFIAASISSKGIKSVQGIDPEVNFTIRTTAYDTNAVPMYSPSHYLAIWVTDTNNQFVQTLKVVGLTAPVLDDLVEWKTQTGNNMVDAISTATLAAHEKHDITWDCTNTLGTEVPDGHYRMWVEYTEEESHLQPIIPPGPKMYVQFEKSGLDFTVAEYNDTLFKEISLTFTPPDAILTTIEITPDSSGVKPYSSIQFTANGYDQFGFPLTITGVTWEINTATHKLSNNGLLTTLGFEGDFEITASLDGVEDKTQITIDADWVGINNIQSGSINLFPIPANDQIKILSSEALGLCTVNILDMNGKNVLSQRINCSNNTNSLSISNLSNGIYIVKISSSSEEIYKQKLIKQ